MPDPSEIVFVKPDRVAGAKRRSRRRRLAPRIDFSTVELDPIPVLKPVAPPDVPPEDIAMEAREKPEENPVAIVTRSRRQQIYVPKPVQGVEQPVSERKERDYPLDPCPLCGGKAEFEELGTYTPTFYVVCQSCFCATQSYGSKYWAAWRWNTRQNPFPKEEGPPDFSPVFVATETETDTETETETVKPAAPKAKKRQRRDCPGQLFFGFMGEPDAVEG